MTSYFDKMTSSAEDGVERFIVSIYDSIFHVTKPISVILLTSLWDNINFGTSTTHSVDIHYFVFISILYTRLVDY